MAWRIFGRKGGIYKEMPRRFPNPSVATENARKALICIDIADHMLPSEANDLDVKNITILLMSLSENALDQINDIQHKYLDKIEIKKLNRFQLLKKE